MHHRSARRTEPGDSAENHGVHLCLSFGLAPHQPSTIDSVMMTAMKATNLADAHGQCAESSGGPVGERLLRLVLIPPYAHVRHRIPLFLIAVIRTDLNTVRPPASDY